MKQTSAGMYLLLNVTLHRFSALSFAEQREWVKPFMWWFSVYKELFSTNLCRVCWSYLKFHAICYARRSNYHWLPSGVEQSCLISIRCSVSRKNSWDSMSYPQAPSLHFEIVGNRFTSNCLKNNTQCGENKCTTSPFWTHHILHSKDHYIDYQELAPGRRNSSPKII